MSANNSLIEIEGLSFAYDQQVVFDGLGWCTDARLNLLLGPSGCGKTTLLRLLARHLSPQDVRTLKTPGRAGVILQDDALFPWLTAEDNLSLVPANLRSPTAPRVLGQLNGIISPLLSRHVAELSFGERRAVELARILSLDLPVLLLDEPLNFLDREKRSAAVAAMVAAAGEGRTIVASTHYPSDYAGLPFTHFHFPRDLPARRLTREAD